MDIPIIFENDRFLVINKPSGIPHHNDDDENPGIVNLLRQQLATQRPLESRPRLYGVHRLDRVTSGILVFAKDSATAASVQQKFQTGDVVKFYVGLSHCKARQKKQGWIIGGMERGRRKSWLLSKVRNKNEAKTRFFTAGLGDIMNFTDTNSPRTLILFRPYTGKTHQLRVAAKSVGLSLIGDPIYTHAGSFREGSEQRTYLHSIGFHLPGEFSIWCVPNFEQAWENNIEISACFHARLIDIAEKYCDCPELLKVAQPSKDFSEV